MRRHNRHHQHGGAISGNATDAVLVHHQWLVPVEPAPTRDHSLRQKIHFLAVEFTPVAGNDKRGEFDFRISVSGDVANDRGELVAIQPFAVDFSKQRGD